MYAVGPMALNRGPYKAAIYKTFILVRNFVLLYFLLSFPLTLWTELYNVYV